jgi:hypothetical protein
LFLRDAVEDENDIVEFAGRSVTEAIGAMLAALGYNVSPPIHAGEHGWELDVRAKGRRFWLQVTRPAGPACCLASQDVTWQFWRDRPSFEEFLSQLDAALRQDGRFDRIGWFRDWRDKSRSAHPVRAD